VGSGRTRTLQARGRHMVDDVTGLGALWARGIR
jgi:hypothetical protein